MFELKSGAAMATPATPMLPPLPLAMQAYQLLIPLYHKLVNMQPVKNILFACDVDEEMSGMEEKIIIIMCFRFLTNLFTNQCFQNRFL